MDAPQILVVSVGGLGSSQMHTIEAEFRKYPQCLVKSAGDWNGYNADLLELIRYNALPYVAAIGHSFAAIPTLELIGARLLQYAAFIDPVSCKMGVSSWDMPNPRPPFRWYRRTNFGIERELTINNAGEPTYINGFHNDLPHNPDLIAQLVSDVLALPNGGPA